MTQKQWEKLQRDRPDLGLIDWTSVEFEPGIDRMKRQEVITAVTAKALIGEEHIFTLDVPF